VTVPYRAYRRNKFATRLPEDRLYTPAHFWLRAVEPGRFQVGFTRFATRMLGEVVEFDFEVAAGSPIEAGQVIGWIEGFKAVAELYTPLSGSFLGRNPELQDRIGEIHSKPYDQGWLYSVAGDAPRDAFDAEGYAGFLDGTIDRMLGQDS